MDNNENLWVGTMNKGLLKYDGNTWTIYDTLNSDIPTNRIKTIKSDTEGNIWLVGGMSEFKDNLVKFDGLNWTTFDPDTNNLLFFLIYHVIIDSNNKKWIYASGQLISYNDTIFNYYNPYLSGISLLHETGMDIDSNGDLYISNLDTGVVIFDRNENWDVFNISDTTDYNKTFGVYIDNENIKWLLSYKGLTKWDNTNIQSFPQSNAPDLDIIIVDSYKDEEGKIYFASGALTIYDGTNWQRYDYKNSPLPVTFINSLDMDSENRLWMSTYDGLVTLQGTTWTIYDTLNSNLPSNFLKEVRVDNNDVVWIASDKGIAKIENGTMTVYNSQNAPLDGDYMNTVAFDEFNNKWFGGETCGLVKFDGNNWTVYKENNSGLFTNKVDDITFDKYGTLWLISAGQAIQSFDGINWATYYPSNYGLPNDQCNAVQGDPYGNVWACLYFNGYAKIDSARNWTLYNNQNSGLLGTNQIVHRIKIDKDGYKWFCTNDGGVSVYRGDIILGVNEVDNNIPELFKLEQNYPNPFNPTTKIKYSIPAGTRDRVSVQLKVYDVLGKEVATLVNEEKPTGNYEVEFSGQYLPSGIYFYQLKAGSFVQTKKMLLLK